MFDLVPDEGLCLGGSSGINIAGAIRMARELGPGHTIVTILCDYGTRYQSKLFNPEFLRAKDLPVPDWMDRAPEIDVPFEKVDVMAIRHAAAFPRRRLSRRDCEAKSSRINERGGIVLDRTIFYATCGGQPGDTGRLVGRGRRRSSRSPRRSTARQGRNRACPGRHRPATGDRRCAVLPSRLGAAVSPDAHAHRLPPPLLADPLPDHRRARSAPRRAGSTSTFATPAPSTRKR